MENKNILIMTNASLLLYALCFMLYAFSLENFIKQPLVSPMRQIPHSHTWNGNTRDPIIDRDLGAPIK